MLYQSIQSKVSSSTSAGGLQRARVEGGVLRDGLVLVEPHDGLCGRVIVRVSDCPDRGHESLKNDGFCEFDGRML